MLQWHLISSRTAAEIELKRSPQDLHLTHDVIRFLEELKYRRLARFW